MVLLRTGKNCLYQSVFVSAHSRSHRLLREFQFLSFWPKHSEKAVSFEEKFLSFCICLLKAKAQPKLSKSKKILKFNASHIGRYTLIKYRNSENFAQNEKLISRAMQEKQHTHTRYRTSSLTVFPVVIAVVVAAV